MINETTQKSKPLLEAIARENPAIADLVYDGYGGYRGSDESIFCSIIGAVRKKVSPVFITYHTQDEIKRYRAWTQAPRGFLEHGRRPDWGNNEDIAIAELRSHKNPSEFFDTKGWHYGFLPYGPFPEDMLAIAELK